MAGHTDAITIISIENRTGIFLAETLRDALRGVSDIPINQKTVDSFNGPTGESRNTLIAAAGPLSLQWAKKHFLNAQAFLLKREILNLSLLHHLYGIPPHQRIAVVNRSANPAIETMRALQRVVPQSLEYVPYWAGSNACMDGIKIAVSPGMLQYCPPEIPKKIDIGMRGIALPSFIRIFTELNLDPDFIDMFVDSFIKRQTDMIIRTFGGKAEQALMQEVFSAMEDAVISLDQDNRILTANVASERMLGMLKKDILGRRLQEILKTIPVLTASVLGGSAKKTCPFLLNGKSVTAMYVSYGVGGRDRRILTIRETPNTLIKDTPPAPGRQPTAKWTFDDIIGTSDAMQKVKRRAKIMAHNDATVLICGETGTGKELFAQAIHNESERRERPFMAFNFAALSESLIESELFGYEEGAFTGAKKGGKKGLFEEAQGGTVFLDEIGDASINIQTRLLRVLQEREILRVGATKTTKIDVKIIAATNHDLKELIQAGKFRIDLYYRLCVLTINIPPLRTRRDCIPDLLAHVMRRYGVNPSKLTPEAYQGLLTYGWPGNVRELVNTVEYLAYTAEQAQTGFYDLPDEIQIALRQNRTQQAAGASATPHDGCAEDALGLFACTFGDQIAENILRTLLVCKKSGLRAGRRMLLERLLRSGLSATEDRLRTMLHFLENNGLIEIGQTKQGTAITPLGERLLQR